MKADLLTVNAVVGLCAYQVYRQVARFSNELTMLSLNILNVQMIAWSLSSLIRSAFENSKRSTLGKRVIAWIPFVGLAAYYAKESAWQKLGITAAFATGLELSHQIFSAFTKEVNKPKTVDRPRMPESNKEKHFKEEKRLSSSMPTSADSFLSFAVSSIVGPPGVGLNLTSVLSWYWEDMEGLKRGTIIHVNDKNDPPTARFVDDLLLNDAITELEKEFKIKFEFRFALEGQGRLEGMPDGTNYYTYMSQACFRRTHTVGEKTIVGDVITNQREKNEITDKIYGLLNSKNRLDVQRASLLLFGGFVHYTTAPNKYPRYFTEKGGIRVFVLNGTLDKAIHFGRPKEVSPEVLKLAQQEGGGYFNEVSVPDLLVRKLSHYRYLPPNHHALQKMREELRDNRFAIQGAFFYLCNVSNFTTVGNVLPIVTRQEAHDILARTHFITEKRDSIYTGVYIYDKDCAVCLEGLSNVKLSCGHYNLCKNCWEEIERTSPTRYENNVPCSTPRCPSCRAEATVIEIAETRVKELLTADRIQAMPSFHLPLQGFNPNDINFRLPSNASISLIQLCTDPTFSSPRFPVPEVLKSYFGNDPDASDCDQLGFIYPLEGKRISWIINFFSDIEKLSKKNEKLKSLFKIGGFVFFKDGAPRKIYAIVNSADAAEVTLPFSRSTDKTPQLFQQEVALMESVPPKGEIESWKDYQRRINNFNCAHITLEALLRFTYAFQITDQIGSNKGLAFAYQGYKKGETCLMALEAQLS